MSESNETVFNNIRSFVQKEVNKVITDHLEKKNYNVNEAQVWTNQICDDVLKSITTVNKNFKFIANCIIMQKADCGLNLSGSCFWDNEVDGTVTVKWDSPSLICIVNVFGCAL
eukprot:GHVR01003006.1.p1 GENE.GHVR01003006.1~~GHVR01003006.1.p1  ORF type:complete len:113 (+),score=5.39 GHVR01003006.1:1661-1999(+)